MIPASFAQTLNIITQKIVAEFQPEKIILFGSYAWGTPHKDSDVDLLVVKQSQERPFRAITLRKILWGTRVPVDLLVYTPSELKKGIHDDGNLFLKDVEDNGTVLYARS